MNEFPPFSLLGQDVSDVVQLSISDVEAAAQLMFTSVYREWTAVVSIVDFVGSSPAVVKNGSLVGGLLEIFLTPWYRLVLWRYMCTLMSSIIRNNILDHVTPFLFVVWVFWGFLALFNPT